MQGREVEMCRDAPLIRLAALPLATFSPHGGEKEAMRAARTGILDLPLPGGESIGVLRTPFLVPRTAMQGIGYACERSEQAG